MPVNETVAPLPSDAEKIYKLGLLAGEPKEVPVGGAIPYAVIPRDAGMMSLERLLARPVRVRAVVEMATLESFLTYFEQFTKVGANTPAVFVGPAESPRVDAVLDYHEKEPEWCDHRVSFIPQFSQEWNEWVGIAERPLSQWDLARFLENHLAHVFEPSSATLLEVAQTFSASKSVEFLSGVNLNNGTTRLTCAEAVEARAGRTNELVVPNTLTLQLRIFRGGDTFKIPARLRYKLVDREIAFFIEIPNRQELVERVWEGVVQQVAEATKLPVWRGKPQLISGATSVEMR